MKNIFLLLFSFLLTFASWAQTEKHPRVVELEEKISEEASHYFARRFPGKPFVATVNVNPLRSKSNGEKTERLPYFEYEAEDSIDEWDDLSIPISFLRNRVTKITLDVLVPSDFDESKIDSMKLDLQMYLRLLPTRDEIKIERKLAVDKETIPNHYYYIMAALVVSAILLGGMIRWSASSIKTTNTGAAGAAAQAPMSAPSSGMSSSRDSGRRNKDPISLNEVTINDSLKLWDQAQGRIKIIVDSQTFPTLSDVILLEELGNKKPSKLGALIYELPSDWQKRLLKFSKGEMWLEAFSNPGKLDNDCLDTLERMVRKRSFTADSPFMEELLIQIWRLGNSAEPFLKRITQDHAFYLLDNLPKSISLPLARKAFPGGWARLLDRRQLNIVPEEEQIQEYLSSSIGILPFYDDVMIEQYRKDREILTYLDSVNIEDERQIYDVLAADSFVKKIRKPFYPVFSLPADKLTSFVGKFSLDAWAMVTMNSPRSYVKTIMDNLDDKKKVVFSSSLKRLDSDPVPLSEVIFWRQQMIASAISMFPDEFTPQQNLKNEQTNPEVKQSA